MGGCRPAALSADSPRSATGNHRGLDRTGRRILVGSGRSGQLIYKRRVESGYVKVRLI